MTAWGSLRFDAIFSIIVSVDSNAIKVLSEKWEDASELIKKRASILEDETERLHRHWKSPKAADAFQERVAESVRRMREWAREAASAGRAGTLKQAAVEVARSQAEMRRLKAARDAELAAAEPEERAAIEEKYDRLARAEGQQLGSAIARLTPWRPPEPYTGLSGLTAPRNGVGFVEPLAAPDGSTQDNTVSQTEPTVLQSGPDQDGQPPPTAGPAGPPPLMPVVPPILPPLGPGVPANAGQQTPATGAAGIAGRAAANPGGFLPNGLFGRLMGATPTLSGMLPSAAVTPGAMTPPIPPAAHPGAAVGGRRMRRRSRAAAYAEPAETPVRTEQEEPEAVGPPAVTGRPADRGRSAPPRAPDGTEKENIVITV